MFSTGITTVPLTVSAPSVSIRYAKYLQSEYCNAPLTFPDKLAPTMNSDYIKLALVSRMVLTNKKEADEFTQLTLQGNIDLILKEKTAINMDSIFKAKGNKRVRLVVVEGAPGIGKSTFALELCRQWPLRESLQCFSLVVLLKLRDEEVRSAKHISDLLPWDDHADKVRLYEEVREENASFCLMALMNSQPSSGKQNKNHP